MRDFDSKGATAPAPGPCRGSLGLDEDSRASTPHWWVERAAQPCRGPIEPGGPPGYRRTILSTIESPGMRFDVLSEDYAESYRMTIFNKRHAVARLLPPDAETWLSDPEGRPFAFGDLVFLPANTPIPVQGSAGQLRVARFEFDVDRFPAVSAVVAELRDRDVGAIVNLSDKAIARSLQALAIEAETPTFASDLYFDGLASVIAASLARRLHGITLDTADKAVAILGLSSGLVDEYIEEHLSKRIQVSDIAAVCGVSERQISRIFAAETGATVQEYVERARIEHAKRFLTVRELPIKVIAHRTGYSAQASFTTAFRRVTGHTPFAFRRALWASSLRRAPGD